MTDTIQYPLAKASTAVGGSAGAFATAKLVELQSFFPNTLAGWMAVFASAAALVYNLHLLWEWYRVKRAVKHSRRRQKATE